MMMMNASSMKYLHLLSLIDGAYLFVNHRITLNWIGKKGEEIKTDGAVGESILDAAHRHDIELEGNSVSRQYIAPYMYICSV